VAHVSGRMSALERIADASQTMRHVRNVPRAEVVGVVEWQSRIAPSRFRANSGPGLYPWRRSAARRLPIMEKAAFGMAS
jgi:hypothetical protein